MRGLKQALLELTITFILALAMTPVAMLAWEIFPGLHQ